MQENIIEYSNKFNFKTLIKNETNEKNNLVFLVENDDLIENITLLHIFDKIKNEKTKINFLGDFDFLNNFLKESERSFSINDKSLIIRNIFLNNDKKPFWKKPNNFLEEITGIPSFGLSPFSFSNPYLNKKTDIIGICVDSFLLNSNTIIRKIRNEIKLCSLISEEYYCENKLQKNENKHPKPFLTNIVEEKIKKPFSFFKDLLLDISKLRFFIGNMNELFLLAYLLLGREYCILLRTENYPEEYFNFFENTIDLNTPWKDLQLIKILETLFEKDL